MPADAEPLHLGFLFKFSAGRWNRRGDYAALYTALTRDGALAELARLRAKAGSAVGPRELVSLEVSVQPVLDLTATAAHEDLAVRAGLAPRIDLLTDDSKEALEYCRRLADTARGQGFTAMLVPSAASRTETNLVIWIDVVAPKDLSLANGPDRERA